MEMNVVNNIFLTNKHHIIGAQGELQLRLNLCFACTLALITYFVHDFAKPDDV